MINHDFLTSEANPLLDRYQKGELNASWASQLDVVGMQPHAREYLEHQATCQRSYRCFETIDGQEIDYAPGIQFTGSP
jgi:hypothetical protein